MGRYYIYVLYIVSIYGFPPIIYLDDRYEGADGLPLPLARLTGAFYIRQTN